MLGISSPKIIYFLIIIVNFKPVIGPFNPTLPFRLLDCPTSSQEDAPGESVFSRLSRTPHTSASESGRAPSGGGLSSSPSGALSLLASSDWEDKVNGLLMLSDLALRNSAAAFANSPDNHSAVVQAVINECKNLRSQVRVSFFNSAR